MSGTMTEEIRQGEYNSADFVFNKFSFSTVILIEIPDEELIHWEDFEVLKQVQMMIWPKTA